MMRRALIATLFGPLILPALPTAAAEQLLSARAAGGWRLDFAPGEAALDAAARDALAHIAPGLAALSQGRITVQAQASGPADDASLARRLSLARAIAVRDALVAAGLPATRIDIRALGRRDPPADRAEILPPGVPRAESGSVSRIKKGAA